MTTDAAQAESGEGSQPQYITAEDFRRFQSTADRRLSEERQLADEAFSRVAELEQQLQGLAARQVEDDDPRYVELSKKLNAAEKRARDAEGLVKRFSPAYKRALVEKEALKLTRGDETMAEQLHRILATGKNEQEVLAIAQEIRTRGLIPAGSVPHPRSGPEVDTGRGSGRGGQPRITQEYVAKIRGTARYEEERPRIMEALKDLGGVLPDR